MGLVLDKQGHSTSKPQDRKHSEGPLESEPLKCLRACRITHAAIHNYARSGQSTVFSAQYKHVELDVALLSGPTVHSLYGDIGYRLTGTKSERVWVATR